MQRGQCLTHSRLLSAQSPSKSRDPALGTFFYLQGKEQPPTSHTNHFPPEENSILFPLSSGTLIARHQLCAGSHLDIHCLRGMGIISLVYRWGCRDTKVGVSELAQALTGREPRTWEGGEGPQRPWKQASSSSLGDPKSGRRRPGGPERRHTGLRARSLWGQMRGSD